MPTVHDSQAYQEIETGRPFVCVWYSGFESLTEAEVFADGIYEKIFFTPDKSTFDG